VKFENVYEPALRQVILSTIGSQLLSIEFNRCSDIDLKIEVLPCSKLESLVIDKYSKLLKQSGSLPIDCGPSSSFLPCLKKLHLEICMRQFSSLFETERPLLTDASLCCLHFGYLPLGIARATGSADWEDFPKVWPNLEMLSIALVGFSLPNLLNVAPRLKSLKRITTKKSIHHYGSVPLQLPQEETHTAALKDFELKNPGIHVHFENIFFNYQQDRNYGCSYFCSY
jgi:hypothetical protein